VTVRTRSANRRHDRGQAAVEFALALPVVIVLVLGLVQVAVVVARQLAVEHAARSAARAASVAADPGAAARSEVDRMSALTAVTVETSATAELVTVTVRYREETTVPIVGRVIGDAELTASVTMRREPP
jgi:Flp pilus assembly protein TadG